MQRRDGEIADLLGIDNDDEHLEVAYDTINWDDIEDELTGLAQRLIAKQGEDVLAALAEPRLGEDDESQRRISEGVACGRAAWDATAPAPPFLSTAAPYCRIMSAAACTLSMSG